MDKNTTKQKDTLKLIFHLIFRDKTWVQEQIIKQK